MIGRANFVEGCATLAFLHWCHPRFFLWAPLPVVSPHAPIGQKAFKTRVRNAVAWLNRNKTEQMRNAIRSMPERLEALVELKGAMTGY